MKKLLLIPLVSLLFVACGDNKAKSTDAAATPSSDAVKPTPTTADPANDAAIKTWLQGKEWKADNGEAPISTLQLMADGKCDYITMKDVWSFAEGKLKIGEGGLASVYPLTKVDDQTFTIVVPSTQKTFTYKWVKNL